MKASFPHLPPGRDPGAQSLRNRSRSVVWEALTAIVGAAMVAAGIFVAAGGRGPEFDRAEEAAGGALFAAIGLLCLAGAYVMRHRRRPVNPGRMPGTSIAASPGEARRGNEVTVMVTLSPGAPAQEGLEVGLVCVERYDQAVRAQHQGGTTTVRQIAHHTAYEEWRTLDAVGGPTFSFRIPADAPYSYEGECVSYAWRVSARLVRRLRSDPRIDDPIWVLP